MSRDVYQMNYSQPGRVLILNNNNFRESPHRPGSEEDVRRLEYVFKSVLKFKVETFRDKNRKETREIIENFSAKDFTKDSCLICFFMSHGNRNTFVTSDDKEISIDDLSGPFKRVKSLKDKPKLFFFQCCRGNDEMAQIDSRQRITSSNPIHHDHSSKIKTDVVETDSVPVEADVLYGYSTVEKFYSYRHPIFGSWFIQTICEIICKNPCIEIKDFINKINKQMKEKEIVMPTFSIQLVADFYFKDPNEEPRNVQTDQSKCLTQEKLHHSSSIFVEDTTIDLSKMRLAYIEQKAFLEFSNLVKLNLTKNHLESINPSTFSTLTNLTHLYLGINKLKDIHVDTFEDLRNLKCLSLSKNQLKYINPLTFVNLTNLRHLELDYNELEYIELVDLKNLQDLYLNSNRLRIISSNTFKDLINIKWIFLQNNQIDYIDENAFRGLRYLEKIKIGANMICRKDPNFVLGLYSRKHVIDIAISQDEDEDD